MAGGRGPRGARREAPTAKKFRPFPRAARCRVVVRPASFAISHLSRRAAARERVSQRAVASGASGVNNPLL